MSFGVVAVVVAIFDEDIGWSKKYFSTLYIFPGISIQGALGKNDLNFSKSKVADMTRILGAAGFTPTTSTEFVVVVSS